MNYSAADFIFEPAPEVARARRVLIKPAAQIALPYPVTTSRETLAALIRGIRRVSDADIILLDGTPVGESARSVSRSLGYDFPRVMILDAKDGVLVEVENPLTKPYALPNFWVPNVLLSCDYLISVAPLKVVNDQGYLSVANLIGLLPATKYSDEMPKTRGLLPRLGFNNLAADLYFTLPFDLGIIDARMKFVTSSEDPTKGEISEYGRIFVGEPAQVDAEASSALGIETEYLRLIEAAQEELEDPERE